MKMYSVREKGKSLRIITDESFKYSMVKRSLVITFLISLIVVAGFVITVLAKEVTKEMKKPSYSIELPGITGMKFYQGHDRFGIYYRNEHYTCTPTPKGEN